MTDRWFDQLDYFSEVASVTVYTLTKVTPKNQTELYDQYLLMTGERPKDYTWNIENWKANVEARSKSYKRTKTSFRTK